MISSNMHEVLESQRLTVTKSVAPSSEHSIQQTMNDILKSTQGKLLAKVSYNLV